MKILEKYNKLYFFCFFLIGFICIYLLYDYSISNINYKPPQPLNFSHKTHSGDFNFRCVYCHWQAEISDYSNIPTSSVCMSCHIGLTTKKELVEPLISSYDSNRVINWISIYRLPDYTRFSHKKHIRVGIDCSSCHSNVEEEDNVSQKVRLSMNWCLDCHRNPFDKIKPLREITGIYYYIDSTKIKSLLRTQNITNPSFGAFYYSVNIFPLKELASRSFTYNGAENCSSCHY